MYKAKRNFVKSILKTSALVASLSLSTDIIAAPYPLIVAPGVGGTANFTTGAHWWGNILPVNGDPIQMGVANNNVQINVTHNFAGFHLNSSDYSNNTLTVDGTANGGSIGSIGGAAANGGFKLIINDSTTYGFTGLAAPAGAGNGSVVTANDYTGISTITLGSAGVADATLVLNATANSLTIKSRIDGVGVGKGVLTLQDNGTKLHANIGNANSLNKINIQENTTIGGTDSTVTVVKANNTYVTSGKTLTIDSSANSIVFTGAVDAVTAGEGHVVLQGTNTITFSTTIGAGTAPKQILFSGDHNLIATGNPSVVYIATTNAGEGTLTIQQNANPTDITAIIGKSFDGNIANLKSVILDNTTGVAKNYRFSEQFVNANEVKFLNGHNDDQIGLGMPGGFFGPPPATQIIMGNITTDRDGHGMLYLRGNGPVLINGNVSKINYTLFQSADDTIYLGSTTSRLFESPITFNADTGKLVVFGGDLRLTGNITCNAANFGYIYGHGLSAANAITAITGANELILTIHGRPAYNGTIEIAGTVTGAGGAGSLALVDATNTGTVKLSSTGIVTIGQVIAKTLSIAGSGDYQITNISTVGEVKLDTNLNLLTGSPWLGSNISALPGLGFGSGNIQLPTNATIYATAISHTAGHLKPLDSVTIKGNYTANNATLTMNEGTFAVANGNTVTLTGTFTTNINYNNDPAKKVKLDFSGANVNVTGLTAANISFTFNPASMPTPNQEMAEVAITDPTARAAFISKLTMSTNNSLVHFTIDPVTGKITNRDGTLTQSISNSSSSEQSNANAKGAELPAISLDTSVQKILTQQAHQSAVTQVATINAAVASTINERLSFTGNIPNIGRASNPSTEINISSKSSDTISQTSVGTISTRGGESEGSSGRSRNTSTTNSDSNTTTEQDRDIRAETVDNERDALVGVSAGDQAEKFGLWVNVVGGIAKQGQRKGNSGSKSNLLGSVIGFDTMVNEQTILGFAINNSSNNVRYTDNKTGDKAFSNSWLFVVYGNYSLKNNWFFRGSLNSGFNAIIYKESRVGMIATSKYNIKSYGGEISTGYNYRALNNVVLTPTLGVRVTYLKDISYNESGADVLNKKVTQKGSTNSALIGGLQCSTKSFINQTSIMPEAHMNFQYGLDMKSPKGDFKLISGGEVVTYVGTKAPAFSTSFGGSVTAYSDNIEYGVGYDMNIAEKYIGHAGSVKVKVHF
jgi:outer membrane autotransporter protein